MRVACILALPTDDMIQMSGAADAGEYLMALMAEDGDEATGAGSAPDAAATRDAAGTTNVAEAGDGAPRPELARSLTLSSTAAARGKPSLEQFVAARKGNWQSEPRQRVWRCVAHLIAYVLRTVEGNATHAARDRALSESEVEEFAERRAKGFALLEMPSASTLLDGIHAASSMVRVQLLTALREVNIFSGFTIEQLVRVRDAMSDATYTRGQYVFRQGEAGDGQLYVVLEGEVSVVRTDGDAGYERELARLRGGEHFGERALLKKQVRYADVRVESSQLRAMSISKAALETALGCPFESVVPDQYQVETAELLRSLRRLPLFERLDDGQLRALASALQESVHDEGEFLFRQGDVGDALYIVLAGQAEVLRSAAGEQGAAAPMQVAVLRQWSCFGEQALLTDNGRRYGSVRAISQELKCLSISRSSFERALGPPQQLLKQEQYKQRPAPRKGVKQKQPTATLSHTVLDAGGMGSAREW